MTFNTDCDLCRLYTNREVVTELYYEDNYIIVVKCKTCHNPMAVVKDHTRYLSLEAITSIHYVWVTKFPTAKLRTQARQIHDHLHFHFE